MSEKKRFLPETFLEFEYLSDCQISPCGGYTAFIAKKADIKNNKYDSALYCIENKNGNVDQITSIGPVASYSWLDEENIVFPAARTTKAKENKAKKIPFTEYYKLSLEGGEAEKIFDLPINSGKLYPLGDGVYALIAAYDDNAPKQEEFSFEESYHMELSKYNNRHYVHFKEIPFIGNGNGFVSRKRNRLYVYDSNNESLEAITSPLFQVGGVKVSGKKILYIGHEYENIKGLKHGIYVYDYETKKNECILEKDKYIVKGFELYEDKAIVNLTDALSFGNGENGDFYTIDINTKELKLLASYSEHCVGNTVTSDIKIGAGQTMKVDNNYLYYISTVNMDAPIKRIDLRSGIIESVTVDGSVDFIDVNNDVIVCIGCVSNKLPEVYNVKNEEYIQITHLNDEISENYKISEPEYISIKGSAPWEIEGYVIKPVNYKPGEKYPGILAIHGGPRLTYGGYFMHEMQTFASEGYFVFYCNPRGSEGKGNEFADIRKKFGDIDYLDFTEFIDGVLEKYPDIDSCKLAVEGGSYGGFMTNWIIGHTDRFAAACSQRSISNWTSMEGTTDIGYYFCKGQTGASHMENHELQWKQSPLAYADKCTTPTLFLHGEEDYRCHLEEALQMYAALKLHDCPAKLCLFAGENHEMSRSGRPKQKLQRLEEMLDWFNIYVKKSK